jgi:hypothetical protein
MTDREIAMGVFTAAGKISDNLAAENAALQQQLATAQHSAKVFAGLLAQVVRFAFNDRCRISASAVQQQLALHIEEQADAVVLAVADHKPKDGIVIAREVPR